MEKLTLKFYKIDRCGYYKEKGINSDLVSIEGVFDNLKEWLEKDNKQLQDTLTTDILAKSEQLPVYCIDVSKSKKGNFLVTTWNKVETTDGNISSIKIDEPLLTATKNVVSTKLPKNSIPGYATYFYIIPEEEILATIKFNHISNGHQGLNSYIKGFLTKYSKYVQYEIDKDDKSKIEITGYGISKIDCDANLYPYFKSSLKKNKTNTQRILSNIASINKIIRKTTVSTTIQEDKDFTTKLMKYLGTTFLSKKDEEFQLKYEMKLAPTKDNVKEIIKSWKSQDSWDDVGFKLKGEDNPIWLSADIPSKEFEFDIKRDNLEFINFNDLLEKLDDKSDDLKKVYSD